MRRTTTTILVVLWVVVGMNWQGVTGRTTITLSVSDSRRLDFEPAEHALDGTNQRSWVAGSDAKLYTYSWSDFALEEAADLSDYVGDRTIQQVAYLDNEDGSGLVAVVAGTYRSSQLFSQPEPFRSTLTLLASSESASSTVVLSSFTIGYDVQSVDFSPGGNWLVCVCQAQVWRTSDTSMGTGGWFDPKGEVYIFDVRDQQQLDTLDVNDATIVDWSQFNDSSDVPEGILLDISPVIPAEAPTPTVADLILPNSCTFESETKMYVSLGNNGVTVIDPRTGDILDMWSLGLQDIGSTGIDASDEDGGIVIRQWPHLKSLRVPDSLIYYAERLWSGNEGIQSNSARVLGYIQRIDTIDSADFDSQSFPDPAAFQDDSDLGRLYVYSFAGLNSDGQFRDLVAIGGRELTSFKANGQLRWSSASEIERNIGATLPAGFNTEVEADSADARSPILGPEVKDVVIGKVESSHFLFTIGDKSSIINVWNIDNPDQPRYETTFSNRNFQLDPPNAGDVGSLELYFIPKHQSATGDYQLVCAFTDSQTYSFYRINYENTSPASLLSLSTSFFFVFLVLSFFMLF